MHLGLVFSGISELTGGVFCFGADQRCTRGCYLRRTLIDLVFQCVECRFWSLRVLSLLDFSVIAWGSTDPNRYPVLQRNGELCSRGDRLLYIFAIYYCWVDLRPPVILRMGGR